MALRQTCVYVALALSLLADPSVASDLKISAWNMEHLAEHNGEGCRPRQDQDYESARKYARLLDADIIAVQEVGSVGAVARVFDPTKYNIEVAIQDLRAGYECDRDNPNSGKSTPQLTGFAIRKGIAYERNTDFEALDVSKNNSLRSGVDITVKGQKPVRLLSVHLKASCPSQPLTGDKRDCKILLKQQPILEEQWMEARYRAGAAFIVLGDFNRHLLSQGDEFSALTNDGEPAGLKLKSLSAIKAVQCSKKYPKRIDHIVVDDRANAFVKADSFQVLTFADGDDPSDHCPISAVFRVN
jgi:endonuclease/exonuclease/phosphatase family metal-dependent hydrolase